jgi:predicted O-methyltransferase YrrM
MDLSEIEEPIKMFFYDGEHGYEETAKALEYVLPTFADETIVVLDDANWEGTVYAANDTFAKLGVEIVYSKLMLNDEEDPLGWWNGVYVMVVRR